MFSQSEPFSSHSCCWGTLHGSGITGVFLTGEFPSGWEVPALVSLGPSQWCLFTVTLLCLHGRHWDTGKAGDFEFLPFSELDLANESPSEVFLLELLKGRLFPSITGWCHSAEHPSAFPGLFCFCSFLVPPGLPFPPFSCSTVTSCSALDPSCWFCPSWLAEMPLETWLTFLHFHGKLFLVMISVVFLSLLELSDLCGFFFSGSPFLVLWNPMSG